MLPQTEYVAIWWGRCQCLTRMSISRGQQGFNPWVVVPALQGQAMGFRQPEISRLLVLQNTPNSSWFGRNHPGAMKLPLFNQDCGLSQQPTTMELGARDTAAYIAGWSHTVWIASFVVLFLRSRHQQKNSASPIRCIVTAALLKGTRKGGTLSLAELARLRCADGRGIPFLIFLPSVSHLSGRPVV